MKLRPGKIRLVKTPYARHLARLANVMTHGEYGKLWLQQARYGHLAPFVFDVMSHFTANDDIDKFVMAYLAGIRISIDGGVPKMLGSNPQGGVIGGLTPAFDYAGVPYVTETLPGVSGQPNTMAIMPTIPNGAHFSGHDWHYLAAGSYDPCKIPTPTPTPGGAVDEYYVAWYGNDATAGNGGKGTTDAPRRQPPVGTFPAGTKIYIEGRGTPIPATYGTSQEADFTAWQSSSFNNLVFTGVKENPCWIIGINKPRVVTRVLDTPGSSHLIWDGIVLTSGESTSYRGSYYPTNCSYLTFRNGAQLGTYMDQGHSFFQMTNCSFSLYYNNIQRFGGMWDGIGTAIKDWHGWRPEYGNRFTWCINNDFSYIAGDGCQPGNSTYTGTQADVSHFILFAGNYGTKLREQLFDAKSAYHCLVSTNYSVDMLNGSVAPNQAHIIIAQDNEGVGGGNDNFYSSHNFAINNLCDGTGTEAQVGIENKNNANNVPSAPYTGAMKRIVGIIGNIVINMSGTGIAVRASAASETDSDVFVCFNTIAFCGGAAIYVTQWQPETGVATHYIDSNVTYECAGGDFIFTDSNALSYNHITNHYAYRAAGGELLEASFTGMGNRTNVVTHVDPQTTDPANGNFTPATGSPLIGQSSEPAIIQLFEDTYGKSLRKDRAGTTRPTGTGWDIGALQRAA